MKYVQINTFPHGSTGKIMMEKHKELLDAGVDSFVIWGRGRAPINNREFKISTDFEIALDGALTRVDGRAGFHSRNSTKRLLKILDNISPDVVHLHNLHGYYVNIEMLFLWLQKHNCKVIMTLHDCWMFTGHCTHFSSSGCNLWQECCDESCSLFRSYPRSFTANSVKSNYLRKKKLFSSLDSSRVTIITPSNWLSCLVAKSYLGKYKTIVLNNKINKDVFKPSKSSFRKVYGIGDRLMVLGVAKPWTKEKGLEDFVRLSGLMDSRREVIVMVGLTKRQIASLPDNIIALPPMSLNDGLVGVYSSADVFFNPTYEDNYPTVNLEAEACGTHVVTYDTGGCRETITSGFSSVVDKGDIFAALKMIRQYGVNDKGNKVE